MKQRDKHGRPTSPGSLVRGDAGYTVVDDTGAWHVASKMEILALNWTGPVPETFEPPRDSKGRPVCRGDAVRVDGNRYAVIGIEPHSRVLRIGPNHCATPDGCTILRFAGEDRDVGAEAGGWRHVPGAVAQYQHTSGAAVTPWNGKWSWARKGEPLCDSDMLAPTRAEAERLALGQSPRAIIAHDADGKELRAGNVLAGSIQTEWRAVLVSDKRACALCRMYQIAPGSEFDINTRLWRFVADAVADVPPVPRDTIPAAAPTTQHDDGTPAKERAPAIVAETEQSRRVREYESFAALVKSGGVVVPKRATLRHDRVEGRKDRRDRPPGVVTELRLDGKRTREIWPWSDGGVTLEHAVQSWINATVCQWDREAGAAMREGGKWR